LEKFTLKENELETTSKTVEHLKERLPKNSSDQSSKGLSRTSQLFVAITLVIVGSLILVLGLGWFIWLFILIGSVLLSVSTYYFRRYKQMEGIIISVARSQGVQNEIDRNNESYKKYMQDLSDLRTEYGVNSSDDFVQDLNTLNAHVKSETGSNNMSELAATLKILSGAFNDNQIENLHKKSSELSTTINELDTKLNNLIQSKPLNLDPETDMTNYEGVEQRQDELSININIINY
jgi:hypothetical protein